MEARFNYAKAAPGVYKAMLGLDQYLEDCGLEESLLHHQTARLPDQRLRLLSRYALEGPARERGTGTAAVLVGRVARMPLLHRTRTRRSGLDGVGHARRQRACARQRVRTSARAFQRERIVGPDCRRLRHQRLEPAVNCEPHGPGSLPSCENSPTRKTSIGERRQGIDLCGWRVTQIVAGDSDLAHDCS